MNVKAIMQYLGKCRREISELANVRGEKCNHSIFRLDTHVP